jgi:hypothetical protein
VFALLGDGAAARLPPLGGLGREVDLPEFRKGFGRTPAAGYFCLQLFQAENGCIQVYQFPS